jgi:hypothetical protein
MMAKKQELTNAELQARQIDDFKKFYSVELTLDIDEDNYFKIRKFDAENKGRIYFVIPRDQYIYDPHKFSYTIQTSSEEAIIIKTYQAIPLSKKHHD